MLASDTEKELVNEVRGGMVCMWELDELARKGGGGGGEREKRRGRECTEQCGSGREYSQSGRQRQAGKQAGSQIYICPDYIICAGQEPGQEPQEGEPEGAERSGKARERNGKMEEEEKRSGVRGGEGGECYVLLAAVSGMNSSLAASCELPDWPKLRVLPASSYY